MNNIVLKADKISKQYRLGQVGTGTISHDLQRWFSKKIKNVDPYLELGEENDRTKKGGEYVWAIKDISFEVEKGDVLGLIGRNGAGKSTLLKVLAQITSLSEGNIGVTGRVASLLEVGTGFHPELTGKENIYLNGSILGMTRKEINNKFNEIVEFSGCAKYIDTPVKRYSSGMMVRLGFAVAAYLEPEILLVDEVLAVGDQDFQEKCIGKIKDVASHGRTVIFVSHNMSSIRSLCNKCILLDKGCIKAIGPTDEIVSRYLKEGVKNYKEYENGPILKVEAESAGGKIFINAEYKTSKKLLIPSLGFVIHDSWGNPILGNNPRNLGYKLDGNYLSEGKINIVVEEPKLLDGEYSISIWFGDGQVDFFEDKECIEFEVISESQNKLIARNIGYVHNKCKYEFN